MTILILVVLMALARWAKAIATTISTIAPLAVVGASTVVLAHIALGGIAPELAALAALAFGLGVAGFLRRRKAVEGMAKTIEFVAGAGVLTLAVVTYPIEMALIGAISVAVITCPRRMKALGQEALFWTATAAVVAVRMAEAATNRLSEIFKTSKGLEKALKILQNVAADAARGTHCDGCHETKVACRCDEMALTWAAEEEAKSTCPICGGNWVMGPCTCERELEAEEARLETRRAARRDRWESYEGFCSVCHRAESRCECEPEVELDSAEEARIWANQFAQICSCRRICEQCAFAPRSSGEYEALKEAKARLLEAERLEGERPEAQPEPVVELAAEPKAEEVAWEEGGFWAPRPGSGYFTWGFTPHHAGRKGQGRLRKERALARRMKERGWQ